MMDDDAFERWLASEVRHEAGPSGPIDDLAIYRTLTTRAQQRRYTPFGALKLAAAGAIVALAVGLMLPGVLTSPSDGTSPGASSSDEPAIHWRSGVVDLQADGVTLRIGDEIFTTEGSEVIVLAKDGNLGAWALYPRWIENGQTTWLELSFKSDGETWTVNPSVRFDAPFRTPREPGRPEPASSEHVGFERREEVRVPLGEAFTGDWRLEAKARVETCDSDELVQVPVTLTFENLRLTVSPREPSILDTLDDTLFHPNSFIGDFVNGWIESPYKRALDCSDAGRVPA